MTTTALVFVGLLATASIGVSTVSAAALKPVRMAGPVVRRWGGFVLIVVGSWFAINAGLPQPLLGG